MSRCAPGSGGGVAPPMWRSYITLVERAARVVGEFHGVVDGGVRDERADGKAMQQQRHSRVAQHVRRLATALDRAEEDVVPRARRRDSGKKDGASD